MTSCVEGLHILLGLGSPLSVPRFWTIIQWKKTQISSKPTWWPLQHIRYSSTLPNQLVLCNIPLHRTACAAISSKWLYDSDGGHSLTLHFRLVCDTAVFILIILYFSQWLVVNFYINFTKEHRVIDFKAIATPISMQVGCTKLMLHM
jgi:hypothetical protein